MVDTDMVVASRDRQITIVERNSLHTQRDIIRHWFRIRPLDHNVGPMACHKRAPPLQS